MKKLFILSFAHLVFGAAFAQMPIPAPPQGKSILLMNGIAHIGNGKVIQNSAIGFRNGKLDLVVDATVSRIDMTRYDQVINIPGKNVYPGFITPSSTLGLVEIGAVRATNDMNEVGYIIPNVRSLIAYNTDSKIIPTVRANGVLIAQVTPRGGRISGTSSIFKLDGWNWEDAVLSPDDGVHVNWPVIMRRSNWWTDAPGPLERNKTYDNDVNDLKKFFLDAKAYNDAATHEEKNLRFEAMKGLFSGKQTLFVHANGMKEITEAITFCKKVGVTKMVIVGGKDAWMVTEVLKENNIAVIVNNTHDLPDRDDDDVDLPYKLPYLLQQAGVLFCLDNECEMEEIQSRNLPFIAGTAVAYGLTKEEGVMSISLNAAKILGIDKYCGSLEEGKDATLFVSTGDALDMRTNNVENAWIQGRTIDLNTEQKQLYEMYMKKYGK
ncbi:MAG TPA: amidohydrolase family protein [Bacteroidia bacterium]|jgi:imidazolonepropionase-like amidohydrolase